MIDNVGFQPAERILALEVRSRRIGFAALEGSTRLLDWGVRNCSCPTPGLRECVAKIVKPLLFHYEPVAVVMRRENQCSSKTASRLRVSMGAIRREASRCGVECRLLKTKVRKRFFVRFRCDTKHQIAQLIAELFEELSWRVQPQRRAWHSESSYCCSCTRTEGKHGGTSYSHHLLLSRLRSRMKFFTERRCLRFF